MPGTHTRQMLNRFLMLMLAGLIAYIGVLGATPPIARDALIHHLALPKLYIQHGGIYEIPFMEFSYFPLNLDLLYTIPLIFHYDVIPKYIHFAFGLLCAWLIYGFLKRKVGKSYGLLGAILFFSTPIVIKLSVSAYVDLGLVFFSMLSLISLLRWQESGFQTRWLLLAGAACGLALGTKYNGLIVLFLLTLFIPVIYLRSEPDTSGKALSAVGYALLFFSIALALFAPYLIKNSLWTGNPLFPLYNGWFNPGTAVGPQSRSWGIFEYRAVIYGETWWEIVLLPLRIFFQGQDDNPQFFDGRLNPALVIFIPFVFMGLKRKTKQVRMETWILFLFAVLYFLFALFSSSLRIRYILPILPPLVILTVMGIKNLRDRLGQLQGSFSGKALGPIVILVLVLLLAGNGRYLIGQFHQIEPFRYLWGASGRNEYLTVKLPYYASMDYANKHLPPDARILFILVGNRGYYCDRQYVYDYPPSAKGFHTIIQAAATPRDTAWLLHQKGITHLLIREDLFIDYIETNFTMEEKRNVGGFMNHMTKRLFAHRGYGLYEIKGGQRHRVDTWTRKSGIVTGG